MLLFFLSLHKMNSNKVFEPVCTAKENDDEMHNERT